MCSRKQKIWWIFLLIFLLTASVNAVCPPGDFNNDCSVDIDDLAELTQRWLAEIDGLYIEDFALLAENWHLQGCPLLINEFLASNNLTYPPDPQGQFDDWIEIYNNSAIPFDIGGMYLTDNLSDPDDYYRVPVGFSAQTTIAPYSFLLLWADEDTQDGPLHLGFKLNAGGEEIGLFDTDRNLVDSIVFDSQVTDVSFGRTMDAGNDWHTLTPSPASSNNGKILYLVDPPGFSHNSGVITTYITLALYTNSDDAIIRFTFDNTEPTPLHGYSYIGPFIIDEPKVVKAIAYIPGLGTSQTIVRQFIKLGTDIHSFTSDLPVVLIDNYGGGPIPDEPKQDAFMLIFEPDEYSGRTSFTDAAALDNRIGIELRGSSTLWMNPKKSYGIEAWDQQGFEKNIAPLGMPSETDWILHAPYDIDRTLMRNALFYGLSNQIDRYAVRTRFAEVFVNTDGGALSEADYVGVYVFMEKSKRDKNRIDIERLNSYDNGLPEIAGGYILRIDRPDVTDLAFTTTRGTTLIHEYPKLGAITFAQATWIRNYMNSFEGALYSLDYRDPDTGYPSYINTDAFLDHNLLNMYSMNADALRLSTFMFKGRYDKLEMGPIWDLNISSGTDYDPWVDRVWNPEIWHGYLDATDYFGYGWWGRLFEDFEFRLAYADKWYHLRETQFSINNINALIDDMTEVLAEAQVRNFQRWPETNTLYYGDWYGEVDHLKQWMSQRAAWVDTNMGIDFAPIPPSIYLNDEPADRGGNASTGDSVSMLASSGGTIYYAIDGLDPRSTQTNPDGQEFVLFDEDASKTVQVPSVENGGSTLYQFPHGLSVTLYRSDIAVTGMDDALDVLSDPEHHLSVDTEIAEVIDYFDTGTNGHYDSNNLFPGLTVAEGADNFVVLVTGLVEINAPGEWTFGVNSDDGFSFEMTNGNSSYSFSYPAPRSPNDTLQTFNIAEPGFYRIRLVYYEYGGGAELELFAAQGSYALFDAGVFRLVGDSDNGGIATYASWTDTDFDDSAWTSGTGIVGFENNVGGAYEDMIDIDVLSEMYDQTASCYIRIPFDLADTDFQHLTLRVKYDDGYIAYLNGFRILEVNYDSSITGPPTWESGANSYHDDTLAIQFVDADLTGHIDKLTAGRNVLAVHALNHGSGSSDLLLSAKLEVTEQAANLPSDSAVVYSGPVTINESTCFKARSLDGGTWSALNEATFSVGPVAESLRITELMYHPADPNTEFVELKNIGLDPVNLNLVAFTDGIYFTFGPDQLDPNEYIVVVENITEFQNKYGTGIDIAGSYAGALDNAGENITLVDAIGTVIHNFEYKDSWYDITDGDGFSLTIKDPYSADPNLWDDKKGWRPSASVGGSPGADDTGVIYDPGTIVINELLAHSNVYPNDWIELHNTTTEPVNIGGWYLSDNNNDDPNYMKYRIADGTSIPANGYIVFTQDENFGQLSTNDGKIIPFALSENGETVYLRSAASDVLTGYYEEEDFSASEVGIAFGRYIKSELDGGVNFVAMSENTRGYENAYPKVGPVIINEIMYNPPTGGLYDHDEYEYIELYNISDTETADLWEYDNEQHINVPWKFTDGIDYTFPLGTSIGPGQRIVVVKNPAAFSARYPTVPGPKIFGPFTDGQLSNGGEQLQLSKPGDESDGIKYYIRVDRVSYDDESPWPTEPDGFGQSLTRINNTAYGNDPINWQPATPSPAE